jgi:hypothetical protein
MERKIIDTKEQRKLDSIAKNFISLSFRDNVFNRVFACENAYGIGKTTNENHGGTKDEQ